jgi:hypothetical protein
MIKKFLAIILGLFVSILLIELIGSSLKLKPKKWSLYYEFNSNYGWYTWPGADHLYGKHENQTNGYKTRGKKPTKEKKIILLGDSYVETSHRLEEMPESYLEKYLQDYSVISFGSWGWGNDQQLLHLRNNIESIKPEYVVLWWVTNDLSDNIVKKGFGGPKPTFKIKDNKIKYPSVNMGDEYTPSKFYKFYTYRLLNKIYEIFLAKLEQKDKYNFEEKKIKKCNSDTEYSNYSDLLKLYVNDKLYDYDKRTFGNKPMPFDRDIILLPPKDKWIDETIKKYTNEFMVNFSDTFFWNRDILTESEKEKIKITNLLIKEMQKISIKNNSKFMVFFPVSHYDRFYPFDNNTYKICYRGNEIEYSNKNGNEKLKLIFDEINNIYIMNDMHEFGDDWQDKFDGHLNNEANNFQMKKLSEYIKNN